MSLSQVTALTGVPAAGLVQETRVSIIIPALNEERMIGRCLEAITRLDFPRDQFEVVVVDNGSRDATVSIAESFARQINLTVLQKKGVRISGLRNAGAQTARGAVLAFLDADCLPPPNWLTGLLALAANGESGVIGAHYLLPEGSTWVGRTWHKYQEAPKAGDVSHVPAGDLIIRREDFLRVGGFDESIQTNEDYELCERVRRHGMAVKAFPEIGVVHLGTAQSLRIFYRKQRWHGTHVVKVFMRDIFHSHNLKAVLFAAYTLFCVAAVLAGGAGMVFGATWRLPAAALGALVVPPLGLSLRQIIAGGDWQDFIPLTVLYLTYGLARARALLKLSSFFQKKGSLT
ncbi:MAG TPA: glycosyltransferase [Candidatus Limnocylindrales bacterium]|nr:glycosyltransferase [Candidatus Limnocylindrales bacterium]